jgi:diadenosine tetraphosphatase ApaH/serine/threonine PP2A family protein phosphatase
MAPLALIYDVHGNLPALEAVLADARAADAQGFLLGGDYALFGPFQAECVAALRALPQATWIRGNVDRWAANPSDLPADDELLLRAVADCREVLGVELADELGKLPEQVVIDGTRYCHASPLSDMRSFLPEPGDDDEELLAGASELLVVFGHTHLQFRRSGPGGVELLNPGSVGLPLDGDARAAYALAHGDGSIEHRRVDYDRDAAIAALGERFGDLDWAQRSIRRLQTSRP